MMKVYYFHFSKLLFQGFRVFCSKFNCISPGLLIPSGFTPECPGHVGKWWNYPQCDSERMERRRRRKKELGRRGAEHNRLKRDFCCCPRTFVLSVSSRRAGQLRTPHRSNVAVVGDLQEAQKWIHKIHFGAICDSP